MLDTLRFGRNVRHGLRVPNQPDESCTSRCVVAPASWCFCSISQLRDLEARLAGCKEASRKEVALLNLQIEQEWETGRKDKEERIKITRKVYI